MAGVSRSVTVSVAYIVTVTDHSWTTALKAVRQSRTVANPNYGFRKQLQEFEDKHLDKVPHNNQYSLSILYCGVIEMPVYALK